MTRNLHCIYSNHRPSLLIIRSLDYHYALVDLVPLPLARVIEFNSRDGRLGRSKFTNCSDRAGVLWKYLGLGCLLTGDLIGGVGMSDMDEDFMYDQDDDYGLVRRSPVHPSPN